MAGTDKGAMQAALQWLRQKAQGNQSKADGPVQLEYGIQESMTPEGHVVYQDYHGHPVNPDELDQTMRERDWRSQVPREDMQYDAWNNGYKARNGQGEAYTMSNETADTEDAAYHRLMKKRGLETGKGVLHIGIPDILEVKHDDDQPLVARMEKLKQRTR